MSSASTSMIAWIAAVSFCLSGCQAVEPSNPLAAPPVQKLDSVAGDTVPKSERPILADSGTCPNRATLEYLRDSSVVLNLKTVAIGNITTNSLYSMDYAPEYAFDGMPSGNWTQWISDDNFRPFTEPAVIQVEYTVPRVVIGYTLLGRYESLKDRLPKSWTLQGSNSSKASANDAVNNPYWTTLDTASNMAIGDQWNSPISYAGITRAISCPASYSRYRLCVMSVNGSSVADLIEVELLARPGGLLVFPRDSAKNPPRFAVVVPKDTIVVPKDTVPVGRDTVFAVTDTFYSTNSVYDWSYGPENAFDHMPPGNWTQWISDDLFRPFVKAAIIQVEYPKARRIASYTLMGRYESLKDRLPKDWVMQGSNDSIASAKDEVTSALWTNLDAVWGAEIGGDWNSTT
ncbi:MAG: discoidin domain-containing protein, partial [Fibrobacterota bacterium]